MHRRKHRVAHRQASQEMFSELLPAFEQKIKSSVKLRFVILQFVLLCRVVELNLED